MTPEAFLKKLTDMMAIVKVPIIILICGIALFQVFIAAFVGGHDKRAVFSTIISLIVMAMLILYIDKFILWLANFVR